MYCVVKISEREALPVRAIPFVTGWSLSPDMVAKALAGIDSAGRIKSLRACSLAPDGSYSRMLAKEWHSIIKALQALSDTLKAEETVEHASYPVWQERSIAMLPSYCFVWHDEFEVAALAGMRVRLLGEESPDENELNFSPWVPVQLVDAVFEGFGIPCSRTQKPVTAPALMLKPNQNPASDNFQLLGQAHMQWWANADNKMYLSNEFFFKLYLIAEFLISFSCL